MERLAKLLDLIGREYLKRWLLLLLSSVVVGVLELIGALLVFGLISAILSPSTEISLPVVGSLNGLFGNPSRHDFLLYLGVAVAVFSVFRGLVFVAQTYLQHRLAHNAAVRLSARLFGAYLRMPYQLHLTRNSSVLLRNVNQSVLEIAIHGFVPIVTVASETLLGVGLAIALIITSPVATGALLLFALPLVGLLLRSSRRAFTRLGNIVQDTGEESLRYSQQSLHGIRDIKTLGREDYFQDLFGRSRARLARALYVRGVLNEVPRVTIETLFMVALGLVLAFSVLTQGSSREALASLGLMAYAGIRLMPSLNRIVGNVNNLQFAKAAIDHCHSELARYEHAYPVDSEDRRIHLREQIRSEDLTFRYEEEGVEILSDVSLTIPRGTSVGVVGPTGAGKSTLVDLLMGLLEPSEGSITVDGMSIKEDTRAWQMSLGVVPQSPFLLDDTLRRNIALGLSDDEIDQNKVVDALELAQLGAFLSELPEGLETQLGERGVRLSGGQRQRVAIARALYHEPDVLFLDEATSALDRVTERRIIEDLTKLRSGITRIMVSHRLTTLKGCDQIVLLEGGRMIDSGTFEELHSRSALFRQMAS